MTPPCPAPAGMRWAVLPADGDLPTAGVLVSDAGVHIVVARDGETWTVYRVTVTVDDDGAIGRHLTILRDGVTAARLPAVLLFLLTAIPTE